MIHRILALGVVSLFVHTPFSQAVSATAYQNDNARTLVNSQETSLNTSDVNGATFGLSRCTCRP